MECPVCCEGIQHHSLCILSCGHCICKACLNGFWKEKILAKSFPLVCPLEECARETEQKEIEEYLFKMLKEKYSEFTFQKYVDKNVKTTSWCPSPSCKAVFACDEGLTEYRCPACGGRFCLACKCEMHEGETCEDYQRLMGMSEEDRLFMKFAKGAKFKQCPSCKFWVEKAEGCDHMTCRCSYEFCYICGGKYGECTCMDDVDDDEEDEVSQEYLSSEEEEEMLRDLKFNEDEEEN